MQPLGRYSTHYSYAAQDAKIDIHSNSGDISCTIKTTKLSLESIKIPNKQGPADYKFYSQLLSVYDNEEVMKKVAGGKQTAEQVAAKINRWSARWFNNDPYSAFAICNKDNEFLGIAVAGHGDNNWQTEIVCILGDTHWNKGYGKEIAHALNTYLTAIVDAGFRYDANSAVTQAVATARVDNPYSCRLSQQMMGDPIKTEEKFGNQRHLYLKDIPERDPEILQREIVSEV